MGFLQARDVVGSIRYAKSRKDTADMSVNLMSFCFGCVTTLNTTNVYLEKKVCA